MASNKTLFACLLIALGCLSRTGARGQDNRVIQLAKVEIDSSQLQTYKSLLKEGIETALKKEPGVMMLYPVADKFRPTHITILEIYADSSAYRSHLKTAHFLKYKSATAGMVKRLELEPVTALIPGKILGCIR